MLTKPPLEKHELEQFFFDQPTIERLADIAQEYPNPCCLCAPMVAVELERRGVPVTTLDIDERFSNLRNFRRYDIFRPEWLGEEFGLIICDPPFWKVSLSQLFTAFRTLARNDFAQPLLVDYLTRRETSLIGALNRFQLAPTEFYPTYLTAHKAVRNQVRFYKNFETGKEL